MYGTILNPLLERVSMFRRFRSPQPAGTKPLGDILDLVQRGEWRKQIESLRGVYATNRKAYDRNKENLPTFYASGIASDARTMLTTTGLLQIDLDDCGPEIARIRECVERDSHIAATFISPSGNGLKLLFWTSNQSVEKAAHREAYAAALSYLTTKYRIRPDPSCSNINRHCLVSFDPHTFRNDAVVRFATPAERREEKSSSERDCETVSSVGSIGHHPSPVEILKAKRVGERRFQAAHPRLLDLYAKVIEPRFEVAARKRNEFIVTMIPFLLRCVSRTAAYDLSILFFDINCSIFAGDRTEHERSTCVMIDTVLSTYPSTLTSEECAIYGLLNDREKDAFRIVRDLAISDAKGPRGRFFMSQRGLGDRLGEDSAIARRILERFVTYGLIRVSKPGKKWAQGEKPESTEYGYMLKFPAQ